jgi:hypothetical protein
MKVPDHTITIFVFFVVNVLMVLLLEQGPSGDEGIYIISGMELLDGFPDSYSSWLNGSPYMWSILAGFVYSQTNLYLLRIVAVAMATIILYLTYHHCKKYVSDENADTAVLMIAVYGAYSSFAQLAVYDILGLLLFMLALVLAERKTPYTLFAAGLFLGFSMITKYAFIIFSPMLFLLVAFNSPKSVLRNLALLGIAAAVVFIPHNLLVFNWIFPVSYGSYDTLKIGFNSLYSLGIILFILFPVLLLFMFYRTKIHLQNKWKWLFITALIYWPVFHLITENPVSAQKHLMFAITFSAPLFAFSFKKAWESKPTLTFITIATFFVIQYGIIFQSWSDLGAANKVLKEQVSPKSTIISNLGTYKTRFALFKKMPGISEQLKNYHQLSEAEKWVDAPADFILWKEIPDAELTAWLTRQLPYYKPIESYSDFFIGGEDHLPWGFHTIEITVYKKNSKSTQ